MIAQGAADRRGVLLLRPARPRRTARYLAMCSQGGRHGDRAARRRAARGAGPGRRRPATSASTTAKAREIVDGRRLRRRRPPPQIAAVLQKLWAVYRERGRHARRGQPAGARPRTATSSRSTARSRSTRTPTSGTRSTRRSRTRAAADPLEARAKEKDLNYVKLDGEVGIIGNGAGLVMSTLDVVAYAGEEFGGVKPANFLDIGGGACAEVMANGLDIILADPQVKSVFVNVFGGITACDAVANGIVGALDALGDEEDQARWSCASTATTSRRAGASSPSATTRCVTHRGHHGRRRPQGRRARRRQLTPEREERHDTHGHLPHRRLQGHRPGHDRLRGHEAHPADARAPAPPIVGGVNPRKAGTTVEFEGGTAVPVFGSVAEAMEATGADVTRHLRAARLHQGRRRSRRSTPASRSPSSSPRASPVKDTAEFCALRPGEGHDADHRPELPRPDQPRGSPTPASSRPTSPGPAGSAWSRSPAR